MKAGKWQRQREKGEQITSQESIAKCKISTKESRAIQSGAPDEQTKTASNKQTNKLSATSGDILRNPCAIDLADRGSPRTRRMVALGHPLRHSTTGNASAADADGRGSILGARASLLSSDVGGKTRYERNPHEKQTR